MASNYEPGNVSLEELTLVNYKGEEFSLLGIYTSIDIFEDIFSSTLSASIMVLDAMDVYQNFPIIGEEKLRIKFRTDIDFELVTLEFYTYEVPTKQFVQDNVSSYRLEFISKEGMMNRGKVVTRALRGTPDAIIKSILDVELQSKRKQYLYGSTNEQVYIPSRAKPLEVIATMANRAVDRNSPDGSSFMFFESLDGFELISLEELIGFGVTFEYRVSRANRPSEKSPYEDELFSIRAFQSTQTSSPITAITGGLYGGTLGVLDLVNRDYKTKTFDYRKDFKKLKTMDKNKVVTSKNEFADMGVNANFKYVLKGTKDLSLLMRSAKLAQMFDGMSKVCDVPGNSELRVGQMIWVDFPSSTGEDAESQDIDRFVSGKYFISSLRHNITAGELGTYTTFIELVKDTYHSDIESHPELIKRITNNGNV